MSQVFIQVAIPVLYVYDTDHFPEKPPGFDMNLLPVISRVLKEHAGTPNVTVITGAPALSKSLDTAYTHLALQYPNLQKASPDAGNLILAELAADNFDPESINNHLNRLLASREAGMRDVVASRYGRGEPIQGAEEALAEESEEGLEVEYVHEEEEADEDEEEDEGPEDEDQKGSRGA